MITTPSVSKAAFSAKFDLGLLDWPENLVNTQEKQILHNMIIWFDGTLRPYRGHNQCSGVWRFDGQFHIHDCKGQQ
jgi:hypothetical protein